MSILEEFIQNQLFSLFNPDITKGKLFYLVSNKYSYINYNDLNFDLNFDYDKGGLNVTFKDKYTKFVLSEDIKIVNRMHTLYKLTNKNIIGHFNEFKIVCNITIEKNDF